MTHEKIHENDKSSWKMYGKPIKKKKGPGGGGGGNVG